MNKLSVMAAAVALSLSTVSCSSTRSATASNTRPIDNITDTRTATDAGIDAIVGGFSPWNDVKVPVTIRLTAPTSVKASGTLTMTRDRSLHLSLRVLGFEVGNLLVRNDSVFATEKMHKSYLAESTAQLLKGFPATVGNLQDLLMGKVFMPGADLGQEAESVQDAFTLQTGTDPNRPGVCILTPSKSLSGLDCGFMLDLLGTPTVLGFIAEEGDNSVNCLYSDFVSSQIGGRIARKSTITAATTKKPISAVIELDLSKAKWNTGVNPTLNIPQNYRRMSASALIEVISSL